MPELPLIAISQRVVEVPSYGEQRDCLDQEWSVWLESVGFHAVPVPNCIDKVLDYLQSIQPDGIILTGGNNLTLDVYNNHEADIPAKDAYQSRDNTERALLDYAIRKQLPLFGCCRGMQFIQCYFGGQLFRIRDSQIDHVAQNHEVSLVDERFCKIAGEDTLSVNSFHNYGISKNTLAPSLRPFAISTGDSLVEGFTHIQFPIVGIMWHPERPNPATAFDRKLANALFLPPDCCLPTQ